MLDMFQIDRLALAVLVVLSGCAFLGDRILQVKVEVVSSDGMPRHGCALGLHMAGSDKPIGVRPNIQGAFLNSFVNPPMYGQYYFRISCSSLTGSFKSATYDFARAPFFHEFGRVVLD
jgi:hypothetical protein